MRDGEGAARGGAAAGHAQRPAVGDDPESRVAGEARARQGQRPGVDELAARGDQQPRKRREGSGSGDRRGPADLKLSVWLLTMPGVLTEPSSPDTLASPDTVTSASIRPPLHARVLVTVNGPS